MSRTLKKAVFLQNVRYSLPENRLAEYHGAIFAEEFRRRGIDATKMVLGDPSKDNPISELLSISSMEQRLSPIWWKEQNYDLVFFFGGCNFKNIPIMKAIKQGLPHAKLVLRMDSSHGPFLPNFSGFIQSLKVNYIKDRHGHVGATGHESASPIMASIRSLTKAFRSLLPTYQKTLIAMFEQPDHISYECESPLSEAKDWARHINRGDIQSKFFLLQCPVRDEFAAKQNNVTRKPGSIISVANWKHAKDLRLHAKATGEVFQKNSTASMTIIGENSEKLLQMIQIANPSAIPRIKQINEISNKELPSFLQQHEVFMMCSFTEGICVAVIEALCSGCSTALSTGSGVPSFREFVAESCGTQAISRKPKDMANAVLNELELWGKKERDSTHIKEVWRKALISTLCTKLCKETGFSCSER